MSSLDPRVDFAALSDEDIANIGLNAAEVAFQHDVEAGLTNGDSLIMTVGDTHIGKWKELGRRGIGPDAEQFAGNVDPETGKLATALQHLMDSVYAYFQFGEHIPEGPQRFTGGVLHVARVKTAKRGWMIRVFAGAASGVQGHLDMATTYSALTRMGAVWALKMQALHGKAS